MDHKVMKENKNMWAMKRELEIKQMSKEEEREKCWKRL